MRLRPVHTRPRSGSISPAEVGDDRALATVVVGPDPELEGRLRAVASRDHSFEVVARVEPDVWGRVPELPDVTDVVVIALSDDARGLAALRELRRANPAWRLVVVARSTDRFEEAFELGADAWVDRAADDRTVELAVTGAPLVRARRRRAFP
jgi:DNA-binding NarL/FixJ family response regulator